MKKIVVLVLSFFFLNACSKVPITGRSRINFVSDAQVLPASFAQYRGFLKENKLSSNRFWSDEIKSVGRNISAAVDRFMRANNMVSEANSYKWEFNLVENKALNAWCLPGGKVVFYTGIMPICKNTDGVATVMGHEIAHAFAKHGQERMSSGQLQQLGGLAVALSTSGKNPETQAIWNMAYGLGSNLGVLKFSRVHESEADKLGLIFMIMAGYNGEEAPRLWVRMSKHSGSRTTPEFLSTHPSPVSRIQTLRDYLPTAKKYAEKFNREAYNRLGK